MPKRNCRARVLTIMAAIGITAVLGTGQTLDPSLDPSQLQAAPTFKNAVDAYIYGYPLIMFGLTERAAITVPDATTKLGAAPLNQFGKELKLPDASFTSVVLPSTSTLYASSFLNLKAEPVILHLPDFAGRFFVLQMLDGWTNVSDHSPSSRLGSQQGDYALVGPEWSGTLPPGITNEIHMPTNSMWIIGRIFTNGTDADIKTVVDTLYPSLTLTPLSFYGKDYTPPSNLPIDPSIDTGITPLKQTAAMDACAFFGTLATMMKYNEAVLPQDAQMVAKLEEIGIAKGMSFDCAALQDNDKAKLAALQLAVITARNVLEFSLPISQTATYWSMPLNVGTYGSQYLLRAEVAENALGANNPKDAVYGYTKNDGTGAPLDGASRYRIHFDRQTNRNRAGEIPPVQGFWSVTIYNNDGTLVANNVVNYNAIGVPYVQGHQACFNTGGSLDLYLQADSPSSGTPFCNWLPTPTNGPYIVFLRMYWPGNAVLSGKWIPPGIQKLN